MSINAKQVYAQVLETSGPAFQQAWEACGLSPATFPENTVEAHYRLTLLLGFAEGWKSAIAHVNKMVWEDHHRRIY